MLKEARKMLNKTTLQNTENRNVLQKVRLSLEEDLIRNAQQDEEKHAAAQHPGLKDDEYYRRVDFTGEEMEEAYDNMKAVVRKQEEEDVALSALTRGNRRLPRYLYSVIPEALRSAERQISALRAEVEILRYDREALQGHRSAVRSLLSEGRRHDDLVKTYRVISRKVPTAEHFEQVMVYLVHYRRLFRLSSVILRSLGSSMAPPPDDIGKAYHMLIAERLQPFAEVPCNKKNVAAREKVAKECVELLHDMLDGRARHKWPIPMPQSAIYLLSQMAPVTMLNDLYWRLVKSSIRVTEFTGFHFVSRLAQPDKTTDVSYWKHAFEILKYIHFRNGNLGTVQARHAFYAVLYQAMRANDPTAAEGILALMTKCGLEPGVEVYNMLMARAAEEKDEAALKKHFNTITESGYRPSMVTHSIAHAFHKHHGNERERVIAMEEGIALNSRLSTFFATDILHAAVLHRKPYEEVFRRYKLYFSTRLLERFQISITSGAAAGVRSGVLEPDHVTLAVMLTAYCYTQRDISKLWDLYKLYVHFLSNTQRTNRTTRRLLLASGSYIPHILMLGLGKRMQGLPYVAAVLEDMLKPNAAIDSDVYSWSIFLNFLTRAGKMKEAETVLEVMRSRGLVPNTVTMTTLLNGYVKAEQLDTAESVLVRMHEAGLDPNVYTWTSLLRGYVQAGKNWDAGDAFRRMLDSSIQPDEITLQAVSGITDRVVFEAGLGGLQAEEGSGEVVQNEDEEDQVISDNGDWFSQ
jgi:pentatricopeptide repeat protein